jgi:hypothetical protein
MSIHTRRFRIVGVAVVILLTVAGRSFATCVPGDLPTPQPRDPVVRVLAQQASCPRTAIEFRNILKQAGAGLEPTMVNFVGFHNPGPGAFFVFEIASGALTGPLSDLSLQRGDLVFGHFTTATGDGRLVSNRQGLTIELIAWDPAKQFYNFYELDGGWFYRGDSKDILDDIRLLHRKRTASERPFGTRLRCSGCHVNGGLLQKELTPPHNDWFVKARPLPMGGLKPDPSVKEILDTLVDAEELRTLVANSPRRLADSPGYRKVLATRSLQEQLRPLFCPVEVNIESDAAAFDDRTPMIRVPSAFFVDSRLAAADVAVERKAYEAALQKLLSTLPETPGRRDADHPWLTPVKAHSDIVAVDALIERGVIDREFALDVLAIDFTNPVFSQTRCGLLTLLPDATDSSFLVRFQDALRGASVPGAPELLGNLTDPLRTAAFHEKQAQAFAASCRGRAGNASTVLDWFRLLAQRRVEVSASEISKNPLGHILEDPNRIVFPETKPRAAAGRLTLTAACQVQ